MNRARLLLACALIFSVGLYFAFAFILMSMGWVFATGFEGCVARGSYIVLFLVFLSAVISFIMEQP